MRYFYFSQIPDANASAHFQKLKISSKIIHFIKIDSFLRDTIYIILPIGIIFAT
ncbi:MAG: hypothetical protein U9R42_10815 [Bacteroidota bacterium]|nr:hypothetical protein [Bacteroidota bacterium]